jgi:hypothetical protein
MNDEDDTDHSEKWDATEPRERSRSYLSYPFYELLVMKLSDEDVDSWQMRWFVKLEPCTVSRNTTCELGTIVVLGMGEDCGVL